MYIYMPPNLSALPVYVCVRMHACMYVCAHVCIYIIYEYIYMPPNLSALHVCVCVCVYSHRFIYTGLYLNERAACSTGTEP